MKYPILYSSNETDFFSLGLGPLKNTIKATVTEERNGAFYFEAEILTDEAIFPLVLNDCLIKADAGHLLKDQRFRIKRIVPKHNGRAEIYAEHVSYLAEELTLRPEVSITGTASSALTAWKGAIVETNPFVVDSDISRTGNTKWRIDKVENPRQALGGPEGSLLDTYGGEYRFDNYRISLLQKRGTTANTVLAYGRNITDFEQERNIANTYTSIVPYAIYTDDNEQEITVTVDGYKVNSQYAGNYPNPRSLPVNFSDKFGHDEIPTKAKLQQLAEQYITDNEVGVPKTSIRVSFLDLSKSADYDKYKHLEEVNLCDDVRVHYPKLGVNTVAKVIRVVWNVLTESYDEIEIGEKRTTLATKINEQSKEIKEINNQTNYALISADGKNIIFYGSYGQDGLGEPTATKIGDSWYKPDGEFTELRIWNGTIWEFIMSTKENHEIRETIEGIEDEIVVMTGNIDTAVANANQAVIDAGFAKDQAETAATLATNANQSAQDAVSQSSQAHQLAVQSATDASTALSNAQTAMTNAQNALNKSIKTNAITYAVSTSQTTVPTSGWQTTVPTASSTQYVWTRTAVTLQDNSVIYIYNVGGRGAQGVKGDTGAGGANAPKITSVKPQFYLSTSNTSQAGGNWSDTIPTWVEGRHYWVRYVTTYDNSTTSTSTPTLDTGLNTALVTSLQAKSATETLSTTVSQHATQIEARALKTTVDTLTGRVDTAEGSITANATAITQKASQSSVDTLTGRVSTAEGQISVQAGQIANRLTASQVETLVNGKGYATQASVNSQVSRIDGDINNWSSQLQSVNAKVDGIEIGIRNLLIRTAEAYSDQGMGYVDSTEPYQGNQTRSVIRSAGEGGRDCYSLRASIVTNEEYYTVSFWAKASKTLQFRNFFYDPNVTISSVNSDGRTSISGDGNSLLTATTIWTRYWITWKKTPSNSTGNRVILGRLENTETGKLCINSPMLVSGNKTMPWQPAPEDNAKASEMTTRINQINQTITDTNNSIQLLTQTVQNQGGSISSISSSLSVETGRINALNTKTNGHETKIGNLQSSYSGLQSTVATVQSDLDGKVSTTVFSDYQQTVEGFQTTVNSQLGNKADKSQITQLSGQISSVVTDVSNLDTEVKKKADALQFRLPSTSSNTDQWGWLATVRIPAIWGTASFGLIVNDREGGNRYGDYQVKIRQGGSMGVDPSIAMYFLDGNSFDATHLRAIVTSKTSSVTEVRLYLRLAGSYISATVEPYNYNISSVVNVTFKPSTSNVTALPSGTVFNASNYGNMSRITQLSDQIDLRVTKGELIGQINTQAGKVLIRANDNVLMVTPQTTYIQDSTIKNAMIDTLSATKITTGTLNAANVNVINLNASNITSGRLNTANITIGTATSGKRVNITEAGLIAHDNNGRLRVKLGVQDIAGDGQSDPSTLVFYTGNGTRSASIGTNTDDTFVIGTEQSGIHTLIRTPTQLTLESSSVRVNSPAVSNNNFWNFAILNINGTQHPNLRANIAGTGTIGTPKEYRLRKIFTVEADTQYLSVGVGDTSVAADFNTGGDSAGGRVWSMATYNRTYSGSANMFITNAGTFGRITSARKYKMDIQVADHAVNNAKKILQINPVSWIDKSAFLNGKSKYRYHGFIADDFHDLGLNEVVVYGADGQVESLAYDRISMYHNVILSEHEQEIQNLKNANAQLLGEIGILRNEVESLRQLVA